MRAVSEPWSGEGAGHPTDPPYQTHTMTLEFFD
jgi:hypothetical protein